MTPNETPPDRGDLAEDVAARLRAAGFDAVQDGENVTVYEKSKTVALEDIASPGKNIATVLRVTLGGAIIALLLSLIWFGMR